MYYISGKWKFHMDGSNLLLIGGIVAIVVMAGMTLYPLLQAAGFIECNCDKSPEDHWNTTKS